MLRSCMAIDKGFRGKRWLGEIIEFEDKKYVVIQILNMKLTIGKVPIVKGKIIVQQVGERFDYSQYNHYYKQQTYTDRIPLEGRNFSDKNIRQLGEIIKFIDEERKAEMLSVITGIESYEYEFADLIVNYRTEMIEPWTE